MTSDTNNTKSDIDYDWVVGVFDTDAENHSLCGDDTNVYNHVAEPTRDKEHSSEQTTITNHQDDEDENIMESLKVSRVERKRKREKQRRIDTNTQFNALADTIQKIEMENDGGVNTEEDVYSDEKVKGVSGLAALNRVDLIALAISHLTKLHDQNEKLRRAVAHLTQEKKKVRRIDFVYFFHVILLWYLKQIYFVCMISSGSGSTRDHRATNWCNTAECNGCSSSISSFYKHDLPVLSHFISATPFSAPASISSRSHGARNGRRSNEASSISVTIP